MHMNKNCDQHVRKIRKFYIGTKQRCVGATVQQKIFVKSDCQAVHQEFIFVKRIARFVFGRSVRLLIGYLHIHDCFWSHTCRFEENLVRNLI